MPLVIMNKMEGISTNRKRLYVANYKSKDQVRKRRKVNQGLKKSAQDDV